MPKHRGTANELAQGRAYRDLVDDYGKDVANCLASKSLLRSGIEASHKDVEVWNTINAASHRGKLDIRDERRRAEDKAGVVAGGAVNRAAAGSKAEHEQ
jgi:hypothetical protein